MTIRQFVQAVHTKWMSNPFRWDNEIKRIRYYNGCFYAILEDKTSVTVYLEDEEIIFGF